MRRLFTVLAVAIVASAWLPVRNAPAQAAGARDASHVLRRTQVCFAVEAIGGGDPQQVSGTLFHTGAYTAESTALLLIHGANAERSSWDGAWPSVKGAPSMARQLAGAGYVVFAIDRLGYGRSPHAGSGYELTSYRYVEMTRQIINQIRAGTYRVGADPCAAGARARHGAAKVVLSGLSSGAAITELYATRHHDVDGIVPMAWSNHGVSKEFLEFWTTEVATQFATSDYVDVFPGEGSCERFLFHVGGVRRHVLDQLCGPEYYGDLDRLQMWTPAGEQAGGPAVQQDIRAAVELVGPTPVLLVFAEHDAIFPGEGRPGDVTSAEIEMWRSRCSCPLSVYVQPDAGHAGLFHDNAPGMADAIIDWLRGRGL